MRLDKLTIGSEKDSPTHRYKNLKNVTIDFDEDHWVTVVIGWNGTGKSNVLEALAIIFRELVHSKKPQIEFAFKLAYRMGEGDETRHIHLDYDPDKTKDIFVIHVATNAEALGEGTLVPFLPDEEKYLALRGKKISLATFLKQKESYLPRYIFSYYSGQSDRMYEVFRPYLEDYDSKLRKGDDPGLKKLFYALPVHSQFVLLAFLVKQNDTIRTFLEEQLAIDPDEGIESVLFVLREPPWKSKADDGDSRFWNARGVVKSFLGRVYENAIAPIRIKRREPVSLWNNKNLEFLYLYLKDVDTLKTLVGEQPPAEFFRDLESTHVSQLIEEVRIRIKLKKNDGSVTFKELSEGEQQLLTVLGLLQFTAGEESLFLIDEADTHLNPKWCVDYLDYLEKFAGSEESAKKTSHIVLTTHNPLAIAELVKEQVQVLKRDISTKSIEAAPPKVDPIGMGYAAIVTSDMFGLASSLDKPTQKLLEEQRHFAAKANLSTTDKERLDEVNQTLDKYGYSYFHPDAEYSRYVRLRDKKLRQLFGVEKDAKIDGAIEMSRDEREKLAQEILEEMLLEESESNGTDS